MVGDANGITAISPALSSPSSPLPSSSPSSSSSSSSAYSMRTYQSTNSSSVKQPAPAACLRNAPPCRRSSYVVPSASTNAHNVSAHVASDSHTHDDDDDDDGDGDGSTWPHAAAALRISSATSSVMAATWPSSSPPSSSSSSSSSSRASSCSVFTYSAAVFGGCCGVAGTAGVVSAATG